MIGDTSYDMEMARAAGVAAIGVNWGYHPHGDAASEAARQSIVVGAMRNSTPRSKRLLFARELA